MLLKPSDHGQIRAAVEAAEAKTSGEICCVLARECSGYWEVPLAWAAGISLIGPAVALMLGVDPVKVSGLFAEWTVAHASTVGSTVNRALSQYIALQAILFVVVALVTSVRPVRELLTPARLKREHVRRRAEEQFAARGLHLTKDRTGVLIFASLAERRAEVIADEGIAAKVPPEAWADVVGALVAGMKARDAGAGFAAAIEKAGAHLAEHFPRRPGDTNELPDTVIELDS